MHSLSYDYNATRQIAAAVGLPNLRLFQVGRQWSNDDGTTLPLACDANGTAPPMRGFGCDGNGLNCAPNVWRNAAHNATVNGAAGTFSAVCYLTAQELMQTELGSDASVGLVEVDWGGSNEATWKTRAVAVARGCAAMSDQVDGCPLTSSALSPTKPNNWGCLYHGMIEPLVRSLRPTLALWYQGEANSDEPPRDYQCQLESLIAEWRGAFNRTAMPFFVVQLAPYWQPPCPPSPPPNTAPCGIGTDYPAIRIAQAKATANTEADTGVASGYAITHDIGDIAGGIHPHNKTEVGRRLALAIRTKVFGVPGLPVIAEPVDPVTVVNNPKDPNAAPVAVVRFRPPPSSLSWGPTHNCSRCCDSGTEVVGVCYNAHGCDNETAASSQHWSSAAAAVVNEGGVGVQVSGKVPAAVRYAWSNFPECLLFDTHALPIGPFSLTVADEPAP